MGGKLLWTGLTFVVALSPLAGSMPLLPVGAILMAIGLVLTWFDR